MYSKHTLYGLLLALAACGGGGGSSGGGSSEPSGVAASSSPPPQVSWYSTAQPLIDRYCMACHRDGSDLAPFPLEEYGQVKAKRSAMIYSLESGTMPPAGYAAPRASESRLLLDWLEDGAPRGDASQTPAPQLTAFTYHADVRGIVEEKCTNCHEKGGIAPFALDDYESLKAAAAASAYSVDAGRMPPWPPTPGYTDFINDRSLSAQEKHVLLDWLQGDMPEGDPVDYRPPAADGDGAPVDFDLTLAMPQAYTPELRPDDHRCFAIEWPLDEFTYVTNVDVLPDAVEQVHHVIVSIAEPEDAATYYAADGRDGRPGWACLGAGGVAGAPLPRQIGGWVPGVGREPIPAGTGSAVKPGSVVVVQMHYNTQVAEPRPDKSSLRLATASEVQRPAHSFLLTDPNWLREGGMPIPAGESEVRHEVTLPAWGLAAVFGEEAGVTRTDPWVMHQGFIHMHNLGATGRTTLLRADGTEQVILDIRDWDFNWQGTYNFERELLVQPDDQIKLECSWDNSQANQAFVNGVQRRSAYVEWGDGSGDEMCLMSVYMTRPKEGYDYAHRASLHVESPVHRQRFAPGDLVPLRFLFNNFSLQQPGGHGGGGHDGGHEGNHGDGGHAAVRSGHYHVYLDTEDDAADHLTAWDANYYFQLPADIEPGEHTLRVTLRGPDHHALGIEQRVLIEVSEADAVQRLPLVAVADWAPLEAAEDSLSGHRPGRVECPDNSWYEEDGALEVETGYCNYLSLGQPSRVDIQRGDHLRLVLWHGDLAFDEPASAHVAVSVDGNLVWEDRVEIPSGAEIYDRRLPLNFDAPAGSQVEYHLHNHGFNAWTLLKLEVERQ